MDENAALGSQDRFEAPTSAFAPPNLPVIALVAALYGASNGVLTIVRGLSVPEMITGENCGAINGAMNTPGAVAKALAPSGAAALWQVGRSYDLPVFGMTAGSLVLVLGFWCAAYLSTRRSLLADA